MAARLPAPTRLELQALAEKRLEEAKILVANNLYDGAVYLAGYTIELAFKARICERLDADYPVEYTNFKTHSYETLLKLAGLEKQLDNKKLSDINFSSNWSYIASQSGGWAETWRYRRVGTATLVDAQRFLSALEDANSGILTWLKTLW